MKKGIAVLAVLVLAGGGAGGYYYWTHMRAQEASGERISSDSEDAVYVDSVSVLAGLGSGNGLIQRFSGVIEPQQTWEVKLENERKVKECLVKEGDEVKEGQKLFYYDTTEDEDKLAQAEIDLERCENDIETSTARKAQLEKEKAKASSEDQLSYTTQILTEENTIKRSEYEYKSKELEIKQLKETIADSSVASEIDGVVKSINDPDDVSSSMSDSSDSAYITILQVGDYRVKGTVNEQNMSQIAEGMEMIVHSRVDESVTWRGTITEINRDKGETNTESSYYSFGSSSDNGNSSTNYPYYVELTSSEGLMLGQHVYMEADMGQEDQKEGIWLDDYYFVTEEDGSAYVWAASASNVLEKRDVTLGEYDEDLSTYQVLEGLDEEDYITAPSEELEEGLPVIYNDFSSLSPSYDGMGMDGEELYDGMGMDGEELYDGMGMDGEALYDGMDGEDFSDDMGDGFTDMDDMENYDLGMDAGDFFEEDMDGDVYDADVEDGLYDDSDSEELNGLEG